MAHPSPARRPPALALAAVTVALAAFVPAAQAHPQRAPRISARAAILVQPQTGDVVFARHPDQRRLIASTTKLMTALLTLEHLPLDRRVRAVYYAAAPAESVVGLIPGEQLTVRDLLRGLLLESGNDAAMTLADAVAGTEADFVREMNDTARDLDLTNTHYANPIGLDAPGNYSSARDLVTLAEHLLKDRFFARTVSLGSATLRSGAHVRHIVNRNTLVRDYRFVDGVKTGHTNAAGYILVGAARRDGVDVVSAVLDEPSESARDADTLALLRYGLSRYRDPVAVRGGQVLGRAGLKYRGGESVALLAQSTVHVILRSGERSRVDTSRLPHEVDGPLSAGDVVARAPVLVGGRVVARVPVVVAHAVSKASLGQRISSFFGGVPVIALIALLVACSLLLEILRRRVRRGRRIQSEPRGGGTETA